LPSAVGGQVAQYVEHVLEVAQLLVLLHSNKARLQVSFQQGHYLYQESRLFVDEVVQRVVIPDSVAQDSQASPQEIRLSFLLRVDQPVQQEHADGPLLHYEPNQLSLLCKHMKNHHQIVDRVIVFCPVFERSRFEPHIEYL
jgi:hypothetical protein